jgi:chromosome segregation ATPase
MQSDANSSKKEEFQQYLEKSGVIDSLTKVLVGLYEAPDKPASAIEFIRTYLSCESSTADVEELQAKVEELTAKLGEAEAALGEANKKNASLEAQVEELKAQA